MCLEALGVAICAPKQPPTLSFTCGKLHMIASERILCDNATGSCVCFFGTCGIIEKTCTAGSIDLSTLQKIRCADCTMREDEVGDRRHGRDLLESPLLTRSPVAKDELERFMTTLHALWRGKEACIYHHTAGAKLQAGDNESENHVDIERLVERITSEIQEESHHGVDKESLKSDNSPRVSVKEESDTKSGIDPEVPVHGEATNDETVSTEKVDEEATNDLGAPEPVVTLEAVVEAAPEAVDDNQAAEESMTDSLPQKTSTPVTIAKPYIGIETSRWAPGGGTAAVVPEKETELAKSPPPVTDTEASPPRTQVSALHPPVRKTNIPQIASMKEFLRGH